MNEITRFDMPSPVEDIINKAIEIELIDTRDIYALAATYGDNWTGMVGEIVEYAYNSRHTNIDIHQYIVMAAEIYWKSIN